jgi:Ca2+-binding EF-hand superfamily protein
MCDEATTRAVGAVFARFDSGSKNHLTRHELRACHIALLGHPPTLAELDVWLPKQQQGPLPQQHQQHEQGANAVQNGVGLAQLCEIVARKVSVQEPDELVRRAFRAFDYRAKGYISIADLEAAVERVAPQLPSRTISLVFSQLDADRDGRVSFKDFHGMMSARPEGRAPNRASPCVPVSHRLSACSR